MYFITKEADLVGKEIVYTHMAKYSEAILIVTKDKGVFVVNQWSDGDQSEIHIYPEHQAKSFIWQADWLLQDLRKLNILSQQDMDAYEEKKRIERENEVLKENEKAKKRRRELYEQLKKEFEEERSLESS